jgi:phospholipid-binding lipoprotein MlaA
MKPYFRFWGRLFSALALLAFLGGCATTGHGNPADPFEGFNRAMFKFNDAVDTVALKPAATVYQKALPTFVQTGVGNFFGNLADAWTAVNNFLQGKLEAGVTDVMRVAVNSTMGLGGLLDIGSEAGLPKHREDFGQTLGKWGVKPGPYVVLPMFGPTTLRDTLALPIDLEGDPWGQVKPTHIFALGSVVRVVDLRAASLDASNLVEDAALDRYEFIRDAYLQRRESKVRDGEAPKQEPRADADDTKAPAPTMALRHVPLNDALVARLDGGTAIVQVESVVGDAASQDSEAKPSALAQEGDAAKRPDVAKSPNAPATDGMPVKAAESAKDKSAKPEDKALVPVASAQ